MAMLLGAFAAAWLPAHATHAGEPSAIRAHAPQVPVASRALLLAMAPRALRTGLLDAPAGVRLGRAASQKTSRGAITSRRSGA